MIYSSSEDAIGDEYLGKLNQEVGLTTSVVFVSLLMGTNINQELAQIAGFLFSVVVVYLVFQRGKGYRKIKDAYLLKYKGIFGFFAITSKIFLFVASFTLLWLLVIGVINAQLLEEFSWL